MTPQSSGPGDGTYPPALEAAEARLIEERRRRTGAAVTAASGAQRLPGDTVGFGLSGGGIRSATFSLGLLQALARVQRLRDIDFLSTVSGGGYIGAFLGRLFTREWIRNPDDVERVLLSQDPAGAPAGLGARVSRWLRDNGRYLAPRGSGDLLLLASIALRNWLAVQVVLIIFTLTICVLLQIVRGGLDSTLATLPIMPAITYFLTCTMPGGATVLWWSPWILVAGLVLAAWVVPAAWAYFLVGRDPAGPRGLHPLSAAILFMAVAASGAVYYGGDFQTGSERLPRFVLSAVVAGVGALALGWLFAGRRRARRSLESGQADFLNLVRNVLSRWLTYGLVTMVVLLVWALLDSLASTIYAVWADDRVSVGHWVSAIFAGLALGGAFARQIATLLASGRSRSRPGIGFSALSWVAAILVVSFWLLSITIASYVVVWRFEPLAGKPPAIGEPLEPTVLGTPRLIVTPSENGYEIVPTLPTIVECPVPTATAAASVPMRQQPHWWYVATAFFGLLLLSIMLGHTRTFANMSSLHAFYAARLTRTFLGGSNERRHQEGTPVTDTIRGDDLAADAYWLWPFRPARAQTPDGPPPVYPWTRGGPLHVVNVTVNETMDAVTGVQHADRKGIGLAVGPAGLSLGVKQHVITDGTTTVVVPDRPSDGGEPHTHQVFSFDGGIPEPLPLGRWVSISGAAFSAAVGARTTVPSAILAGMFNVRLGYWWDSGTTGHRRSWFARAFPVQNALLSEVLARTRGTADRLWNLSDGGHFENMGGYELIRRRLPIIVIVDAEADPDYLFEGLSDLVRKARIDFNAEIVFCNNRELSGHLPAPYVGESPVPVLPPGVRRYFGDLDALRRGRWSDEPLPPVDDGEGKRYNIEADRTRVSRAHAALARVHYLDRDQSSWLVYIKATLMGDEPEDVCHYHRAHPEFPQEPTTDQFFDEAQWESYRRLGQHIGHRVLTPELIDHLRSVSAAAPITLRTT